MPVSRLDVLYRKLLLTKFFTKGWGPPENILRLFEFRKNVSSRGMCFKLVSPDYPISIINKQYSSDCQIIEGKFRSPLSELLPGLVSPEIHDAFFQMVLPLKWRSENYKPVCIHLAGTGDHYFWRRRNIMAKPLLREGIGSIILENPYYGLRKPKKQIRSSLHYVSDIFVMGGSLIFECIALLNWCEKRGFGPLGVSGISMGGHMASLAASNWPKPLVLVPCLSWSTASSVFTEGVMSDSIDWDMLQEQYLSNPTYHEFLSKQCRIVDNPFKSSLSKIPGYEIDIISRHTDVNVIERVTPFEVVSLTNMIANCAEIPYLGNESKKDIRNLIKDHPFNFNKKAFVIKNRNKEAIWFMRGMMDECTHLKNFSVPCDTSLIIAVCAESDGYVPKMGTTHLQDLWPGATVKIVKTGHVGAYIWHLKVFRDAVIEAFEKAQKVVPPPIQDVQEI